MSAIRATDSNTQPVTDLAEAPWAWRRTRNVLGPAFTVFMFLLALAALHHLLHAHHFHEIISSARSIAGWRIAIAAMLTALAYMVLGGYDALGLVYAEHRLAYPKVALTSFLAYACSMNLGFAPITGSAIRYRLYSGWNLTAVQIAKVAAFAGLVIWLGFFALSGVVFLIESMALPNVTGVTWLNSTLIGVAFLMIVAAFLVLSFCIRRPLRIRQWEIATPPPVLTVLGLGVAVADWGLAAGVLYTLCPEALQLNFTAFLSVFLMAQFAGLISHVPGGLGIFESAMLLLLNGRVDSAGMVGALLAYRVVYYLAPFGIAAVSLAASEIARRRTTLVRVASGVSGITSPVVPPVLAVMLFLGGAILLFSGATPTLPERIGRLRHFIPLTVVELSHFVGSLCGAALLILARGIQRRLDAAYWLTILLLVLGVAASLLKGFDYEEAIILSAMLLILIPSRAHFHRRAALSSPSLTSGWIAGIVMVLAGSIWLGAFSYKHVEYANDLWWRFSYSGDASRTMRALVGAASVLVMIAAIRLLKPAPPRTALPTEDELSDAARIIAREALTTGYFALLGDKSLLFNADRNAFVMYGVHHRSWVALGGVVGPASTHAELVWDFLERVDRHGGWPVFYEVRAGELPLFVDAGLTPAKLGESARIALPTFSLDGKTRKDLRQATNRFEREQCRFEVLPPDAVVAVLPELKVISDDWLAKKNVREKRFSVGFFDNAYLARCPIAVVRLPDHSIAAFANLWCGANQEELSIDLMRYVDRGPNGIMEFLLTQIALWGRTQGFRWFDLGMAPLAGFQKHPLAPIWNRVGNFLFDHAEHFYNFEGLRQYKEKFDPVWEPRYLMYPGGIILPNVLLDCAALSAGGVLGIIK